MSLDHPLLLQNKTCILQAEAVQRKADREGRDLTAEESAEIDGLLKQAKQARAEWDDEPQPRVTTPPPLQDHNGNPFQTPTLGGSGPSGGSVAAQLFGRQTDNGGFNSFGDFLATIDSGRFDQRLMAANTTGIDSSAGFLVPEMFRNEMLDAAVEETILVKRVRRFPMTSDTLNISGFDANDNSSSLYGGLAAAWEEELPTLSEQSTKSRRISFAAKKLMILNRSSNEVVADAAGWERMLGSALVTSMAWQMDYALLRGTGAGQPLGCLNCDSKIEVAKAANQTSATIWYSNIVSMFARLHPQCYNTAIWVINPTCITELLTMDMHASAGSDALVGDNQYIPFRERDGKFTLFGRPVEVTEKVPTLGTAGDIMLIDPQMYGLAMRKEITVERSAHAGFSTDSTYFRSTLRADGMPLWSQAYTPRNGSSLSWCVTLASRD